MFTDMNPVLLAILLIMGLLFTICVARDEIAAQRIHSNIDKLMSVIAVYKNQLDELRHMDHRLQEVISLYEGVDNQIMFEFERRLHANLIKAQTINNKMQRVLKSINTLEYSLLT